MYYIPLQPAPEISVKIGKERLCGLYGRKGTYYGASQTFERRLFDAYNLLPSE